MKKFEKGFLLGAATAAHQVEGNNVNSDMWAMEQMETTSFAEPSADAVDEYHRYEEDILLLKNAGLNAYRFSIEWARIEPREGVFDEDAMRHYLDEIAFCRANGVEPVVTLHHFSSPKWLITKGGWEAPSTPDDFEKYVRYVIGRIGSQVNYVCTINEANMGLQVAALAKRYEMVIQKMLAQRAADPDSATDADGAVQVGINLEKMMAGKEKAAQENLKVFGVKELKYFTSMLGPEGDEIVMRAHAKARDAIKELYPDIKVGLTLSLHDIQPQEGGEQRALQEWSDEFAHYLPVIGDDDFLGVQNYTRSLMGPDGQLPNPEGAEITQMDYEFYPEALGHVIRKVTEDFKGDIIVTENGIATADDSRREEFIRRALGGVQDCIADGLPVKGYFHWSLLDNFEWQKGFAMTFGLIAVDRRTQKRYPKESLKVLGSYAPV